MDVAGLWAIRFTLIALAVSPLRRLANWPRIASTRRMFGLAAMAYALAHLLLYAWDQRFQWLIIMHEIAVRIYLTIGFAALLTVCMLGLTSTDRWIARLGRNWKRLHQAVFALGFLGIVHFFMQSKANVSEAVLIAGFFLWLSIWRGLPVRWQGQFVPLFVLAVSSGIGAAFIEFAWYGLATRVPATRVLQANLSLSFGLRPAVWVCAIGFAVAVLTSTRSSAIRMIAGREPLRGSEHNTALKHWC